jgi:lysophospholipase L1-like esterase
LTGSGRKAAGFSAGAESGFLSLARRDSVPAMKSLPCRSSAVLLAACLAGRLVAAEQLPDGRIVFSAPEATNLTKAALLPGQPARLVIDAGGSAQWSFKPTRWGRYDIVSGEGVVPEAGVSATLAGTTVVADAGRAAADVLGRVYLEKSDPFTLSVTNGAAQAWILANLTLRPAPEGEPITQAADGVIQLRSQDATTYSVMMRYEPAANKNCLGYWVNPADWADWEFKVEKAGAYDVEVWQGCGRGNGGSEAAVEAAGKRLSFTVEETGHFQNFVPRLVGRITLDAGMNRLAIRPQSKKAAAVMDIRRIRLLPANGPEAPTAGARAFLRAKRIVVLGDSITYGGEWVEFVEAWMREAYPAVDVEFLNLGLPSETASGLSEAGHAGGEFPRPDVHERLGRVLEKTKPDLILACYGMNDGIYFPLGEDRFAKFREGMRKLHEVAAHEGIRVVHLTPPVFDAVPLAGKTLPAGRSEYPSPYEGYDDVLAAYSKWLVDQRSIGWEIVDIHGPMRRFLDDRRLSDPAFKFAGDGVHANTQGQWVMARELLRHLGAPPALVDASGPDALVAAHPKGGEILKLVQQRQRVLKDAWITSVGHNRPGMSKGKDLAEAEAEARAAQGQLKQIGR